MTAADDDLARAINSVAIHVVRRVRRTDDALGVPPARLSALSVLVFGGPRSVSQLAAAEQVTGPTMTKVVDGLVKTGLVERRPHPDDSRAVLVVPTPRGRRVMERGRRLREEHLRAMLSAATANELECLGEAMAILRRLLADDPPRP